MSLFRNTNATVPNRLLGYRTQLSIYGRAIPILYGQMRMAPSPIWTGGWTSQPADGAKGTKGKGTAIQYQYIAAVLFGLCKGPVQGVFSIWQDKDKFNLAYATEYCTGVTTYTSLHGGTGSPEWWVLNISVSRQDTIGPITVTDPGSPASVTIPAQSVWTPMELVSSSPAAGQYTLTGVAGNGNSSPPGYAIYGFSSADATSGKKIRIQYAYQINDFSIQGSPMSHLNLELFTGTQGQTPWGLLTGNPNYVSQALGYSELAYIACQALNLGTAGILPSLNFEVLARLGPPDVISPSGSEGADCNPADIIRDMLTNPLDGVLGWTTAYTTSAPSQPVLTQITGEGQIFTVGLVYPGYGTHFQINSGGLNTQLSIGQQITINGKLTTVTGYASSNGISISPPVYANINLITFNYQWSAWVLSASGPVQSVGSSQWLPANAAPWGLGAGSQIYNYCAANGIFISALLDQQTEAREILLRILAIANADAFWSEGMLKFGSYGDTTTVGAAGSVPGQGPVVYSPQTAPVYTINDSCFRGGRPLEWPQPDSLEVKNEVTVEWTNRSADYAQNTLPPSQDAAMVAKYGRRPDNTRAYHEITTQPVALAVQSTILKRLCYIEGAGKATFTLPAYFALLDCMDNLSIIEQYLGLDPYTVRIIEIEEQKNGDLKCTAEAFPWSVSGPTEFPSQQHTPTLAGYFASPGNVNNPVFVALPAEVTQGNEYVVGIGLSGGPAWGGAAVYVSSDPAGPFEFAGMATGAATMGYLTAALPVGSDPDTTDTLEINLTESFGAIDSTYVSAPAPSTFLADSFQSLCQVDGELLSFETATVTGLYGYNLTYLRRGVYDTQISAHAVGAQFCQVLGGYLFQYNYGASNVGKTLYFKFLSVNVAGGNQQALDQVSAFSWSVPTPRPPWPLNAGYTLPQSGDAMFTAETFGVAQVYPSGQTQNGLPAPAIQIYGNPPLNTPSSLVGAPSIVSVTQSTTGGSIAGGFTYLIAINCLDAASGIINQSFLSGPVAVAVPAGTNTNQLTITVAWPTGSYGGNVYVARTNDSGGYHYEAAFGIGAPTSGSVAYTLNTITGVGQGPPDGQMNHQEYHVLRVFVSGPFNQTCASVGMFAATVAITAGGTGYVLGDVLTLAGGTFGTPATVTVTAVSSGVVTGVVISFIGTYSAVPSNAVATTGGTGSGCTLNMTWSGAAGVIAFGAVTTGYNFAGRALSKTANVMVASPGQIPLQDFVINSNDNAGNMSVSPDPVAAGCLPGDIFSLRTGSGISGVSVASPLTAGNSGGQGYFIDPLMTNPYNTKGLVKHGNGGNLAAVVSGTGAGQPFVTVLDNNGPSDTPANKVFTTPWTIVPDATSVIELLEAQPQVVVVGNPIPMQNYSQWQGLMASPSVPNYSGQVVRVEVYTVDSAGIKGPQNTVAARDVFVEGAQGTVTA